MSLLVAASASALAASRLNVIGRPSRAFHRSMAESEHHRSCADSRSVGLITGEMMPVAVVAGQDVARSKVHGAVSLGPNAGVAVALLRITA